MVKERKRKEREKEEKKEKEKKKGEKGKKKKRKGKKEKRFAPCISRGRNEKSCCFNSKDYKTVRYSLL